MKLIFAIVSDEDSPRLVSELNKKGYRVTRLNSSGGFLRSGNTTLMTVTDDEKLGHQREHDPFGYGGFVYPLSRGGHDRWRDFICRQCRTL